MKKNVIKVMAMAFAMSLALIFTGCGSGSTALEKMVSDPSTQAMADMMAGDDFKAELSVENGNILVFRFTFNETLDLSDAETKDLLVSLLDDELNNQADTFTGTRDDLRKDLDMSNLSIRIIYCNGDGTELISKDF